MAKNDAKVTDNPKLKEKILSDGQISLYLEYYLGYTQVYDEKKAKNVIKHNRKKEFLSLYVWQAPRTPIERQQNKSTYELARKIRFEREQEFKENIYGYRLKKDRNINFLDYFQAYNDNYTKKDYRMMVLTLNRFKDFLRDTEEYSKYTLFIKPEQITKELVSNFVDYIQGRRENDRSFNADGTGKINLQTLLKKCNGNIKTNMIR